MTKAGFHPRAVLVEPTDNRKGSSFIGVPTKIVIHTTETDGYTPRRSVFFPPDNHFWPHATITEDSIFQHFPIDVGVFALFHEAGAAPEINRANAIQCEVVHRAGAVGTGKPTSPDLWTDKLLDQLGDWVSWVQSQTGVPTVFAEMFRAGVTVASVNSPIRFSDQEWLDFNGICGHSNVPGGNDHFDPGRLPVDRLTVRLTHAGIGPSIPPREEDAEMFIADVKGLEHPQIIGAGWRKSIRSGVTADILLKAGVKHLGQLDSQVGADLIDLDELPSVLDGAKAVV